MKSHKNLIIIMLKQIYYRFAESNNFQKIEILIDVDQKLVYTLLCYELTIHVPSFHVLNLS